MDFFEWLQIKWKAITGWVADKVTALLRRVAGWLDRLAAKLSDPSFRKLVLVIGGGVAKLIAKARARKLIENLSAQAGRSAAENWHALVKKMQSEPAEASLQMTEAERKLLRDELHGSVLVGEFE